MSWEKRLGRQTSHPLYLPELEKDSCGVGFVAHVAGTASHEIVEKAIQCVVNLTHRGAIGADAKTGDGAGIQTQIPQKFFVRELNRLGYRRMKVDKNTPLGVGMIFFPHADYKQRERSRSIVESVISKYKLKILGWRHVPIDTSVLGEKAASTRPDVEQIFMQPKTQRAFASEEDYERTLYLVRKEIEKNIDQESIEDFYICSFSSRTIVYKGLLVAPQLKKFYLDLNDPDFESAFAIFHQRYSTNTFPNWFLAQPFRFLAHNGEINTLQGNRLWMKAREAELAHPYFGRRLEFLKPLITPGGSDSASLDNVLEALTMAGRNPIHAMMMLVPEAWKNMPKMDPAWRAFYRYHSSLSEPWDGPAALVFSDGKILGATLDRNGLRPARYIITKDGFLVMGSEVGLIPIDEERVLEKGRLGPGKMIVVNFQKKKVLKDFEVKDEIVRARPYEDWLERNMIPLPSFEPLPSSAEADEVTLHQKQVSFGYTFEELSMVVKPMVIDAKDPVGAMGDDTPLAVLSKKERLLETYFKQLFAQVTNPAIDPIREELVMSLHTLLGRRLNFFEETERHAQLIELQSPILFNEGLTWLRNLKQPAFLSTTLEIFFPVERGEEGLEEALDAVCEQAEKAVREGTTLLILSDRGVNEKKVPVPILLAVGAVHHHLINQGLRMRCSLIAETGMPREIHHFALLLGYGADAINPYLVYEIIESFVKKEEVKGYTIAQALKNYRKAVEQGILKIMSKMGISAVSSYRGAQIFEAIGLSRSLVERCFTGTPSRVGGVDFATLARDMLSWHQKAFGEKSMDRLEQGGYYRYRQDGEYHAANPQVVRALQVAARSGAWEDYQKFAELVNNREPTCLRDLLEFHSDRKPIPIEEVESVEDIRRRFFTPGISYGALSIEMHKALAIAMNRIGGLSNSGEGGEDPSRYKPLPNGDSANSAIKQVASGRFGVTPEYLMSAKQLEIKIAQGSKPGEGGQLPGHKVSVEIARVRHSTPGITLISPPPHHDIYSIEDIAQLIYDLKMINPKAKVCVKLVSAAGVGTVAAGVAKGHADIIQISGCDGGTGASPLSSIKNAGVPWELGLSETQQVLVLNDLRERVVLRIDGGLKTGRDVVIGAILGAEEFGFGTTALIAAGCCMIRACHLNTCPVGVATQNEKLRAKFTGTPEAIIHYLTGVAQEVRALLATLGYRRLEEIIGRTDLLEERLELVNPKAKSLDLSALLAQSDPHGNRPRFHTWERNDWENDQPLDGQILSDVEEALTGKRKIRVEYPIRNIHRAVGARVAGEIARRYTDAGLPPETIHLVFHGTAGQSFGAFAIHGMRLELTGEANDYVGKGMHGGEIIIRPPANATYETHKNVLIGNTVLYGATGGTLYCAGRAGERFCVRNSGADAVIEGGGSHMCEYMTGGIVVCLGEVGWNFGAGMTGGLAYVLDEEGVFEERYNPQLVRIVRLVDHVEEAIIQRMILRHLEYTRSRRAQAILDRWDHFRKLFWKVEPHPSETKIRYEVVINVNRDEKGYPIPNAELARNVRNMK